MKSLNNEIATAALGIAIVVIGIEPVVAEGMSNELRSQSWKMTQGGKIYDNWATVLYFDTSKLGTHSAYPQTSKKSGATTWRCKECHGWDYKGVDGSYGKGSHYTGIKGLRDQVGKPHESIEKVVRNALHGYTKAMIPDPALKELALFISRGQVDMDQYIDRASKKIYGDPQQGVSFYENICANCHGFDGRQMNFKSAPKVEFIGTVANANPWEALHKIRNGHPGVPMVSLGMLSIKDQIDILAYCQTLPKE